MMRINSTQACQGKHGRYELWVTHTEQSRQYPFPIVAGVARLAMLGNAADTEMQLGLNKDKLPSPQAILDLAKQRVYNQLFLGRIGQPVITTLVRECNMPQHHNWFINHDITVRTGPQIENVPAGSNSAPFVEVVDRAVWVASGAEHRRISSATLVLDNLRIGRGRFRDATGSFYPIVSAPLTPEEQQTAVRGDTELVAVHPSRPGRALAYAALHSDGHGGTLERIYEVPELAA